jgi:DNA-binding GntR family transcriptional regulator
MGHAAAQKAIANIQAERPVVCTIEEYYSTVRIVLQRYALAQAAQGHPEVVQRVAAEIRRLDTAQAEGSWPGAYRALWERLFVWCGRRYVTGILAQRYFHRAHGIPRPARQAQGHQTWRAWCRRTWLSLCRLSASQHWRRP